MEFSLEGCYLRPHERSKYIVPPKLHLSLKTSRLTCDVICVRCICACSCSLAMHFSNLSGIARNLEMCTNQQGLKPLHRMLTLKAENSDEKQTATQGCFKLERVKMLRNAQAQVLS